MLLAAAVEWSLPAASYLWAIPLLVAGVVLGPIRPGRGGALRLASFVVLVLAAAVWVLDRIEVLRFLVAVFGRLEMVTPTFAYPVLMLLPGLMMAPPLLAALS